MDRTPTPTHDNQEGRENLNSQLLAVCAEPQPLVETVQSLLSSGADVNVQGPKGENPLRLVAEHSSNVRVGEVLIRAGATGDKPGINADNKKNSFVLYALSVAASEPFVRQLIESGFNVDSRDSQGQSVIHVCCERRYSDSLLETFIERGASAKSIDHLHNTALHLCVTNQPCLRRMAAGATDERVYELMGRLLKAGLGIDSLNRKRQTPLHLAIESADIKKVQFILSHGADPYLMNEHEVSPLLAARSAVDSEITKIVEEAALDEQRVVVFKERELAINRVKTAIGEELRAGKKWQTFSKEPEFVWCEGDRFLYQYDEGGDRVEISEVKAFRLMFKGSANYNYTEPELIVWQKCLDQLR